MNAHLQSGSAWLWVPTCMSCEASHLLYPFNYLNIIIVEKLYQNLNLLRKPQRQ